MIATRIVWWWMVLATAGVIGAVTLAARAEEAAAPAASAKVQWSAVDTKGDKVTVPDSGRVTLLLFIMPAQDHSQQVIKELRQVVGQREDLRVIALVSGEQADQRARDLAAGDGWTWPVVSDPGYEASGKLGVRVWPTTLVIAADGAEAAHVAGAPASYAKDVAAYVEFAQGKLDGAALKERLSTHAVVSSTSSDKANRHLQLAERLLAQGQRDAARTELAQGLKLQPDEAALHLALARVDLLDGKAREAMQRLDALPKNAAPAGRLLTLRGAALVQMQEWDKAAAVLTDALKLNPDPAEAHYLLARVLEHKGDAKGAMQHYRAAYEHTPQGRQTAVTTGK
ncbi:MAG: tetratricopeptide repeat protein [Phycisphaeraceae bacterium]